LAISFFRLTKVSQEVVQEYKFSLKSKHAKKITAGIWLISSDGLMFLWVFNKKLLQRLPTTTAKNL